MREIRTQTEINATAGRVWQVLTDFAAFPRWNPFIRQARGELREGARLEVVLQPPGHGAMTFRPVLLRVDPPRELRWRGRLWLSALFSGEHVFSIEPLAAGTVRFVQREEFRGVLVPLLWRSLNCDTRRGFDEMNRALKRLAEEGGDEGRQESGRGSSY
jgi:hypothetical protein